MMSGQSQIDIFLFVIVRPKMSSSVAHAQCLHVLGNVDSIHKFIPEHLKARQATTFSIDFQLTILFLRE